MERLSEVTAPSLIGRAVIGLDGVTNGIETQDGRASRVVVRWSTTLAKIYCRGEAAEARVGHNRARLGSETLISRKTRIMYLESKSEGLVGQVFQIGLNQQSHQ
jgi:hypothetical protein